jgi:diguanylate cyclase (GGDEF)-like protein/PAS domain S-box-containing protein
MAFRLLPPGSSLDPGTRAARHRGMLAVLAAQAVALAVWALATGASVGHMLVEVVPLAIAFAAAASPRFTQGARASAMALGLFTESAIAVHLSHGLVTVHFHYFVMLCLLALYEDFAALALGVAYVVVQHGLMGTMAPESVYGPTAEIRDPWLMAGLHGTFVLAAAAALVANWRAHGQVRLSERLLRRRAERYIEVAGVLHVVLDPRGRVEMANRMTCATLGLPHEQLVGADWFETAVAPEERAARRAGFDALIAGDGDRLELELDIDNVIVCADGSTRIMEWVVTAIHDDDGTVAGVLSSGTDVTERRAAEARLERERRDLAGLRRIAQDVASLEDARAAVVERVVELTDGAFGSLLEPSPAGGALNVTVATEPTFVGNRIPIGEGPSAAATAFESGETVFIAEEAYHRVASGARFKALGISSMVCHPIDAGGERLGVLTVGWTDPQQSLEDRAAELVRLAADEAAHALQRRAALQRLESAALNDALTGVPNRRAFDEELPRALARAERSGEPLALAYMDLNGFKALNDRDGHAAGDRLLKGIAAAWQAQLRQTDVLARIGGDEFAVVLPNCAASDLDTMVERLRDAVDHQPGCGLGIVVWDGAESAASLQHRADEALYADKTRGAHARPTDPERLAALAATGLLDAPSLPELDELARIVTWLLDVSSATVSLVDDRRQSFAGRCGVPGMAADERGTPIEASFRRPAVATGRPLIVDDAREHPLLRDNPAIRERDAIAYAGIPLVDADDNILGVLCAFDERPRRWSDEDVATLRRLAQRAIGQLAPSTAS